MTDLRLGRNRLSGDTPPTAMYRTAWFLFAAMLLAIAVYGVVALVVGARVATATGAQTIANPLVVTGFFAAVAGGLVFRRIHRDIPVSPPPGSESGTPDFARARRALTLMIVAWALFDAAAIVGLVLHLMGGKGWPLMALGFGLLAIHPPRRAFFGQAAREA